MARITISNEALEALDRITRQLGRGTDRRTTISNVVSWLSRQDPMLIEGMILDQPEDGYNEAVGLLDLWRQLRGPIRVRFGYRQYTLTETGTWFDAGDAEVLEHLEQDLGG